MRVYATAVVLAALAGLASQARAQNLPPVALATADAEEPLVGEEVTFSGARSFDPDAGPEALSFEWDFDDGMVANGVEVTHTFAAARAYRVRVRVTDSEASTEAALTLYVLAPTAAPSRRSLPLAMGPARVFVTEPIASRVLALDRATLEPAWSTAVPGPRTLALSPDGANIWVACADGFLRVLGRSTGELVREIDLGSTLEGIVALEAGGALVTSPDDALMHVLDPELTVVDEVDVGPDPRAIAVDGAGETAYVASFLTRSPGTTGLVTAVDLATLSPEGIELSLDTSPDSASSGGGVPNLLGTIAISPSGETLWVGGMKTNSGRGLFADGRELTPENRVRGLLAPVSLPARGDQANLRIDTNDAGQVSAMAFSPRGRFIYVAHPGVGAISVYDLAAAALFEGREPGSTVPFETRIDVGATPDALLAEGDQLYVRLRESLSLVVLDVSDPSRPVIEGRASLGADPRPSEVSLGALMFHSSRAPLLSRAGYISCAACHPDGGTDGRTWDFTQFGEGLRSTIDLRGRAGIGHGPLHWSANFDEVQDFENDIVGGFGGEGLAGDGEGPHPSLGPRPNGGRSAELDGLAAYVTSLDRAPRSPHRTANGGLTEAGERGRRLFFDAEVGCTTCHAPPRFTNSSFDFELYDVGTLRASSGSRLGETLEGLDTPTLLGVWATAPYLHDGRALDLMAVVSTENALDQHGRTTQLTDAERRDLVAYLMQIDDREAERPPPSSGCSSVPGRSAPLAALMIGIAIASLWRRRSGA